MHAGGDDRMLDMFFADKPDPLGQCSTSYDGIKSAMIGLAANESIKTGRRIELTEFLKSHSAREVLVIVTDALETKNKKH